jgi:hypothetical protein
MSRPGHGAGCLIVSLSLLWGCTPSATPGHVRDIASPHLRLVDRNESPDQPPDWRVQLSNLDARGRCLQLGDDVQILVNGRPANIYRRGQMERPGKALLAVPECGPLEGSVRTDESKTETEEVVEVRDTTGSLHATFPAFRGAPRVLDGALH